MTRIPDDLVRRVRERANLFVLARVWLPELKPQGKELVCCCPFHREKTPSFTVFAKHGRQWWKCHGCGAGGDALTLLRALERLTFHEAFVALAQRMGEPLPPEITAGVTRGLSRETGRPPKPLPRRDAQAEERERARAAERLERNIGTWRAAGALQDSAAWRYLAGRRLALPLLAPWLAPLRAAPALPYYLGTRQIGTAPAMLGLIQGPDRQPQGVHQTYLAEVEGGVGKARFQDGEGKLLPAKKMQGEAKGGAVRFGPLASTLYCAEGIETALSVLQTLLASAETALRVEAGDISVWALLSLGNWSGAGKEEVRRRPHPRSRQTAAAEVDGRLLQPPKQPWLPSAIPDPSPPAWLPLGACPDGDGVLRGPVTRVIWCADSDGKDPESGEALVQRGAERVRRCGIAAAVARAPAGMDFNDWLQAQGEA